MQNFERLITRVKQRFNIGQNTETIRLDMLAQGMNEDLVFWAIRAAEFEIAEQEKENV